MKDIENIIEFREKKLKYLEKYDNATDIELGTEGFGTFISKVGNFFKSKLNSIKEIFNITGSEKQTLNSFINKSKDMSVNMNGMQSTANTISSKGGEFFKAIGDIIVPTIPGIKVDFLELSGVLSSKTEVLVNGVKPTLSKVDTYLSKLINDEDFRMSLTPDNISNDIKNLSDGLNKDLVKIIDPKRVDDKTQLKNLIPNLSSLKTITDNFKSSIIVKDLKLVGDIYDLNMAISIKIDSLINLLNQNKKVNISKVRLDELCQVLKYSSQLITDTSAFIRLTDAGHKILEHILSRLEKIK